MTEIVAAHGKRNMGRQQKRWVDDIKSVAGNEWTEAA